MDVEIELVGGLGNQLFGYYAGLYFCSKYNAELSLDFSNLVIPIHEKSDLRDFELNPHKQKLRILNKTAPGGFIRKAHDKVIFSFPKLCKAIHPMTEFVIDSSQFGENPSGVKSRLVLRGYFGNFEYFESVKDKYPKLQLKNPSVGYLRLMREAETSRPIMLHIRRGDYVAHSKVYGLLSSDYYLQAIDFASKRTKQDEVWVFSDDYQAATKILRSCSNRLRLIENEIKLTPAESMMIQSLGIANITANSTFSAWGAALNSYAVEKICPKTYFLDNRETPHWPPSGWTALQSSWE
jgi:hypothetical protein